MRWNITIPKRTISLALTAVMAFGCLLNTPVTSAANNITTTPAIAPDLSLGAAQGYNLVCFNNFEGGKTDILGKCFIGGNVNCPSGFTFGSTQIKTDDYCLALGSTKESSFSIGGDGNVICKALLYNKAVININNNPSFTFNIPYETWGKNDLQSNIEYFKKLTGIDLSTDVSNETLTQDGKDKQVPNIQQQMINKSNYLGGLKPTGSYVLNAVNPDWRKLNLTGDKTDVNIFNISVEDLNVANEIFVKIPKDSFAIFNVTGNQDVKFINSQIKYVDSNNTSSTYENNPAQKKLLWNFRDTKNIEFATSVHGSMLAPKANLTVSKSGNFEGELIVNNANLIVPETVGGTYEGHNYPFDPPQVSPPLARTKTATLVKWDDRTYDIKLSASGEDTNAIIKDYIDPRFEVVKASDGNLKQDMHGPYVEWSNTTTGALRCSASDWTRTITVKAKDEFIGGNDIPTNGDGSGIYNSKGELLKAFPMPTVNVKPRFYIGNDGTRIFRGEVVPPSQQLQPYTLDKGNNHVTGDGMYCGKEQTGTFTYVWKDEKGQKIPGAEAICSPGQHPDKDTHYTLSATFKPYDATAASNANSTTGGITYTAVATDNTIVQNSAEGIYKVYVVSGELDISKTIDHLYPAPTEVYAHQSFVFTIQRFDSSDSHCTKALETFYEVITPDNASKYGIKAIKGLKQGYYKITEATGQGTDAWRYTQKEVQDNDDWNNTSKTDNIVYIGREISESSPINKQYFGAQEKIVYDPIKKTNITIAATPATIDFTNTLTNKHWLGDTKVVVNNISNKKLD